MRIKTRLHLSNYELVERRKTLGYTQEVFADILGISQVLYSEYECLKKLPDESMARMIAIELDTTIDVLFPEGYIKMVDVWSQKDKSSVIDYHPDLMENQEVRLLEETNAKITVEKLLGCLSDKEKQIMEYRKELSLDETGRRMGVTRERVRQVEAKAFDKMRVYAKTNNISQ